MPREERKDDPRPVILAVDSDERALTRIAHELTRRYAADYRVMCEKSPAVALERLGALRDAGEEVALVLAAQWTEGMTGEDLLTRTGSLHPDARRGLLIEWGGWGHRPTAQAVLRAMALRRMDYYVLKPWRSPDELFHRTVSEFLHEWSRVGSAETREVVVVGDSWSPRSHELRALLGRNGVPHVFHACDSPQGRRLLAREGHGTAEGPVVFLYGGRVLVNPDNAELAEAYGVNTELGEERDFDIIVVGAGPAGLSAGVYASSEGLRALVIEGESIGGQAGSSSLIRNYLGFSRGITGAELAQRAYQQAWVFGTRFLLMRRAVGLRTEGDQHILSISDGSEARARAVILATGVTYRRLGIPSLEDLTGAGVFYGASSGEAQGLAGEDVFVVGGGNSAGQAALHLARYARRVSVVVRAVSLESSMSQYLRREIAAAPNVDLRLGTELVGGGGDRRLSHLELRRKGEDAIERVAAGAVFILIGARPHTGWLPPSIARDEWGFIMTGPDVPRPAGSPGAGPFMFETSLPGVFAVGDVRHDSVKRVASAVGEGSVAIQQVHRYLSARDRLAATVEREG